MDAFFLNLEIHGTKLRQVMQFKSSILEDKITTWNISRLKIICCSLSKTKRQLFNYNIDTKNLVNFWYDYDEDYQCISFEIRWIFDRMVNLKIKDKMVFFITKDSPYEMNVEVYDQNDKLIANKVINLSIKAQVDICEPPSHLYLELPLCIKKSTFIDLLKFKIASKDGIEDIATIEICAPTFFQLKRKNKEKYVYGVKPRDGEIFKNEFNSYEIKCLGKLKDPTSVFRVYQPTDNNAPLKISGNIAELGEWELYTYNAYTELKED